MGQGWKISNHYKLYNHFHAPCWYLDQNPLQNSWPLPNAVFRLLRPSDRHLLQPPTVVACLLVFLHSVLHLITERWAPMGSN